MPESPVFVVIWRKGRKTWRLEQLPLKTRSVNTELFRLGLEFINVSQIGRWRGRRLNTGWKRLGNHLVPQMGGFAALFFFHFYISKIKGDNVPIHSGSVCWQFPTFDGPNNQKFNGRWTASERSAAKLSRTSSRIKLSKPRLTSLVGPLL